MPLRATRILRVGTYQIHGRLEVSSDGQIPGSPSRIGPPWIFSRIWRQPAGLRVWSFCDLDAWSNCSDIAIPHIAQTVTVRCR